MGLDTDPVSECVLGKKHKSKWMFYRNEGRKIGKVTVELSIF